MIEKIAVCALMKSILINLTIVLFTKNQPFDLPYIQSHTSFTVYPVPFYITSRMEADTFGKELKVQKEQYTVVQSV